MKIDVHRSECSLWRGEHLVLTWFRYRFEPSASVFAEAPTGFRKARTASVLVPVDAPIGSHRRRDEDGRWWLVTYFNDHGLDATSVHYLAMRNERGFKLI